MADEVSAATLITLGESLGLLTTGTVGRLANHAHMELRMGGAESNVAIAVARLGGTATWVGRVGDDGIGELLVNRIRGEGVTVHAIVDDAPTSLMVKERRTPATTRVTYYRHGGPGSRLSPDDVPERAIAQADILHVTGVTAALSASALAAVHAAVDVALAADVTVSFDVNYRAALWPAAAAQPVLRELANRADVLFAGEDEAVLLGLDVSRGDPSWPRQSPIRDRNGEIVIKRGPAGASAWDGQSLHEIGAPAVTAVDPVGAGDAFVGGYLAERLAGRTVAQRLATAAACGAFAVTAVGDWEGSPSRADLESMGADPAAVRR